MELNGDVFTVETQLINGNEQRHENTPPEISAWIREQKVFFVATAPRALDGHINVSPKGGDAFRVLGPLEVVYQGFRGTGAETAAHVRENGLGWIAFRIRVGTRFLSINFKANEKRSTAGPR
jgi:hypothetical protein